LKDTQISTGVDKRGSASTLRFTLNVATSCFVRKARERIETKRVPGVFNLGAVANGPTALGHWFECDAAPARKYLIFNNSTPCVEWLAGTDRSWGDVRCNSKVQKRMQQRKGRDGHIFSNFGDLYLDWLRF